MSLRERFSLLTRAEQFLLEIANFVEVELTKLLGLDPYYIMEKKLTLIFSVV